MINGGIWWLNDHTVKTRGIQLTPIMFSLWEAIKSGLWRLEEYVLHDCFFYMINLVILWPNTWETTVNTRGTQRTFTIYSLWEAIKSGVLRLEEYVNEALHDSFFYMINEGIWWAQLTPTIFNLWEAIKSRAWRLEEYIRCITRPQLIKGVQSISKNELNSLQHNFMLKHTKLLKT